VSIPIFDKGTVNEKVVELHVTSVMRPFTLTSTIMEIVKLNLKIANSVHSMSE
jgi:hypothetical protein